MVRNCGGRGSLRIDAVTIREGRECRRTRHPQPGCRKQPLERIAGAGIGGGTILGSTSGGLGAGATMRAGRPAAVVAEAAPAGQAVRLVAAAPPHVGTVLVVSVVGD